MGTLGTVHKTFEVSLCFCCVWVGMKGSGALA
jgi:hypothetical protein